LSAWFLGFRSEFRTLGLCCLLAACGGEDSDSEAPIDTTDTFEGCRQTEIFVDGPSAPRVGDSWGVILKCADDDSVITGPMTIRVTPTEAATVSENNVTFRQAGEATIRVQVGSYVETERVTVAP